MENIDLQMKGNIDRLKEELSLKKTELERLRKTKLNLEKGLLS